MSKSTTRKVAKKVGKATWKTVRFVGEAGLAYGEAVNDASARHAMMCALEDELVNARSDHRMHVAVVANGLEYPVYAAYRAPLPFYGLIEEVRVYKYGRLVRIHSC